MTVTARRPSTLMELFRPQWMRDPYALYRELRERQPVYWDQPMQSWVVLSYAEIVELTRDHRLSEDRVTPFYDRLPPDKRAAIAPLARALSDMMLFANPPRHTRLRALARKAFTPRMADDLEPAVRRKVGLLFARVASRGRMDVIGDLSEPLTCDVIADMLGVPQGDRPLLAGWTSLLHEFFMQSQAEVTRVNRLRETFDELSAGRRRTPGPDLLSRMLAIQADHGTAGSGVEISDDELFASFLLLIDAGQVTTTHSIANALRVLLLHPDQLELLRQRPELIPTALHELMRYDSAVQFTSRIAVDDIEVGGRHIRPGQSVTLVLGAGNRDPLRFPEPDRLDVTRTANDQLSFGHGIHYCLGAPLALRESEVVLTTLLGTRDLRLDAADADLAWHDTINFRFLKSLPVTFTVA